MIKQGLQSMRSLWKGLRFQNNLQGRYFCHNYHLMIHVSLHNWGFMKVIVETVMFKTLF